ncbi:hypothetical protein [Massilia consociata]|uniref:Uncharacterized protein n=1 Tax=Massilia consociata TaxID=760117 RepID=A0ABV6FAK8_9BURK
MFAWVDLILTWILFLSLFPMAFFWLRHAWRIAVLKDMSGVALRRGVPPANPARFAPYALLINGTAGCAALFVILSVLFGQIAYAHWTAMAGITVWCKLTLDFILRHHAHHRNTTQNRGV